MLPVDSDVPDTEDDRSAEQDDGSAEQKEKGFVASQEQERICPSRCLTALRRVRRHAALSSFASRYVTCVCLFA
jgi:hypothetical protein